MYRSIVRSALSILAVLIVLSISVRPAAARGRSDIAVSISASAPSVRVGKSITYTVTVTNLGPTDAIGDVQIYHLLPDQLTFVSLTCQGVSPDTPACEYGSLPRGASRTSSLVATPKRGTAGQLVSVSAVFLGYIETTDPNSKNDQASVTTLIRRGS